MPVPAILFVHGALTGAWIWRIWRADMQARGWRPVVIDVRGHGRSVPIDLSAVTLEDYVADVGSVAAQVEVAEGAHPVMAGWDIGGLVAMMYAAQNPAVPALLLASPALPLEAGGKASIDEVRRFAGELLTPASFGLDAGEPEKAPSEALAELTDEERIALLEQLRDSTESGIAYRQALRGVSVPSDSIEAPGLVLYGDRLEPERQARMQDLGPHLHGESLVLPGTGHWGMVASESSVAEAARIADDWLRHTLPEVP